MTFITGEVTFLVSHSLYALYVCLQVQRGVVEVAVAEVLSNLGHECSQY